MTNIARGDIAIDGKTAILGQQIDDGQEITINGRPLKRKTTFTYLLFHKPVGYVCSRRQQGDAE